MKTNHSRSAALSCFESDHGKPWAVFMLVLSALVASGSLAAAQDDADAIDLRPRWETGQTARYHFTNTRTSHSVVSFNGNTQETDMTVDSEGDVVWTVDEVKDNGDAVCTMTLDWMTASFTGEGESAQNDSRKGSGDIPYVHDLLKAMTKKELKVHVNADGSIEKVEGIKAMRDAAEDADAIPDERDFLETATDLATVPFAPAAAVAGDSWEAEFEWNYGIVGMDVGSLTQGWEFTLAGTEDIGGVPVAIINGTSDGMKLDDSKAQDEMPPEAPPVKIKLADSEGTSNVIFDLSRHEAVGRTTALTTKLDIAIPLPNGQTIHRTVEETIVSQTLRVAEE